MRTEDEKKAHAEYMRQWREKNPERWREIAQAARRKWKTNNRDAHRVAQQEHRHAVRKEILTLLGGALRCQSCGWDKDWRALQIDHIHGNGRQDSRTSGGNTNLWSLRNWIRQYPEAAKAMYQVLCANCNWIKRADNQEHCGEYIPKELP